MTDIAWISSAVAAARPQAVAALLRYFRDLDVAEEAFQEACLRALKAWPKNGPPRDPAAWLIFVGRNSGIDALRKRARQAPMPAEDQVSDLDDVETGAVERLDGAHYRDDILRLLFICCHPDLPQTQQIALALRVVSGLSVKQIARAFLVGESAMEQRITRAKARVADAGVPFETPGAVERSERLAAVAAMIYLVFNEGYSAGSGEASARAPLAEEAGVAVVVTGASAALVRMPRVTLTRLCVALLDNAVQHSPTGATVEISAATSGDTVEVRVHDAGAGISDADRDRIFERFARGPESGRRRGFGLGLALVREAATTVGGTVGIESTSSRGTTMVLRLPAA